MPLSKAKNKARMWELRHPVQPVCNLNPRQPVQPGKAKLNLVQPVQPKKQIQRQLQALIHTIENRKQSPDVKVPIYNPRVHKAGDTVRKWDGKNYVVVTVPNIDADGHEYGNSD